MAADKTSGVVDVETDHEYDGIREFDNPLPAWWLWTFALTTVFGIVYWMAYHSLPAQGSFQAHYAELEEFNQRMLAQTVTDEELVAIAADPAAVAAGRETYVVQCVACHGDQGQGGIGANLTDPYWIQGQTPKEIWTSISFGSPTKGMPAWRPVLGDTKIRELYAYIATLMDTNVPGRVPEGVDASGKAP